MSEQKGFWSRINPFGGDDMADLVESQTIDSTPAETPLREAYGATVDVDEDNWRPLTGDAIRDISPLTQWRMREIARYLWESTPLGNWLVEIAIDFIVAEGVKLKAKAEDAQKWLDAFWNDPINRMDLTLEEKIRELSLYGEQCWLAFVNELSGHLRLGYLNPGLIETVIMDPDNPSMPIGIVTCRDKKGRYRKYRIIINGDEDVFTERTRKIRAEFTDGECFYFKINSLCEGKHGRSDLLPIADWLDAYEQFMFNETERANLMKAFVWDIELTGADKETVNQRAREIAAPKSGAVRVHNENEKWNAVSPNLNSYEAAAGARMFRNHILGGRAMPEHWFGGGGDVNRATAGEMDEPTMKRLKRRQRFIKFMLEMVGNYQIRMRLASEQTKPDYDVLADYMAVAEMPELVSSDVTKFGAALQQVAASVGLLVNSNIITQEDGLLFIERIAGEMDIAFDAKGALERAVKAAGKKAENDLFKDPPVVSEETA